MKRRSLFSAIVAMTVAGVRRPAVAGTALVVRPAAEVNASRARPPVQWADVDLRDWLQQCEGPVIGPTIGCRFSEGRPAEVRVARGAHPAACTESTAEASAPGAEQR